MENTFNKCIEVEQLLNVVKERKYSKIAFYSRFDGPEVEALSFTYDTSMLLFATWLLYKLKGSLPDNVLSLYQYDVETRFLDLDMVKSNNQDTLFVILRDKPNTELDNRFADCNNVVYANVSDEFQTLENVRYYFKYYLFILREAITTGVSELSLTRVADIYEKLEELIPYAINDGMTETTSTDLLTPHQDKIFKFLKKHYTEELKIAGIQKLDDICNFNGKKVPLSKSLDQAICVLDGLHYVRSNLSNKLKIEKVGSRGCVVHSAEVTFGYAYDNYLNTKVLIKLLDNLREIGIDMLLAKKACNDQIFYTLYALTKLSDVDLNTIYAYCLDDSREFSQFDISVYGFETRGSVTIYKDN